MPDSLFGQTFACSCGKTHSITPERVVLDDDVVRQLPNILGAATDGRQVVVLMDVRTQAVAGNNAVAALVDAGWAAQPLIVPDPQTGSPICDDLTRDRLANELQPADAFLTVGGGVISDLGKWLSFEQDVPYVSMATAASMNGYASANVAPTIEGVKTLVRARPPVAVAASLPILQQAPTEMTASGLGDILAKSVSSTDWYLNHLLFDDYYCERSVNLIAEIEPLYMEHPEDVRDAKPQAIEALFQGLLLTGVAMTMAETSSPSSGGEHMVSHALDMMSTVDGQPHDLHGRQVGVGTILASEVYARVLALESPSFHHPQPEVDTAFWGPLATVVAGHYAEKQERLQTARAQLSQGHAWDELRTSLADMVRPPAVTRDCLSRAGAAHKADHIQCTPARLLTAFQHAHEIRSRFTILDLARLVGILPGACEDIVAQWAG